MKRIAVLILTGGALGWAATASAQVGEETPVPSFDIEAWCEEVSQSTGGSHVIKQGCIQNERDALQTARRMADPGERIRTWCEEVATSVGGSYVIYEGCIRNELEARDGGR